jgi:mono/diheme cytochrome c family protein
MYKLNFWVNRFHPFKEGLEMRILLLSILMACGSTPEPQPVAPPSPVVPEEPKEEAPLPKEPEAPQEVEKPEEATARTGEEVYTQVCQSCHMANGEGLSKVYPPLAGSKWPMMAPDVSIRIVLHGLMGEIEVKGEKYNNVMAPWGAVLDDQEVANVLNYVRSSWGHTGAEEVTVEKVAEIRAQYDGHASWKAEELLGE